MTDWWQQHEIKTPFSSAPKKKLLVVGEQSNMIAGFVNTIMCGWKQFLLQRSDVLAIVFRQICGGNCLQDHSGVLPIIKLTITEECSVQQQPDETPITEERSLQPDEMWKLSFEFQKTARHECVHSHQITSGLILTSTAALAATTTQTSTFSFFFFFSTFTLLVAVISFLQ